MIDWGIAERLAGMVAGTGGRGGDLLASIEDVSRQSEELVGSYTTLEPSGPLPPAEAVTRREWAQMNLDGMRPLIDPVAEKIGAGALGPLRGPLQAGAGYLIAAEVGLLAGYLSQRVLGQYDLAVLDPEAPTRLVFVGENLVQARRILDVDGDELVKWIALHEVTHAFEFAGVPWLRAHLAGLVRELLAAVDVRVDPRALLRVPTGSELRAWAEDVRRDGLVSVVASAEQREVLARIQSLMAVLEGYSEHVMDAVGERMLDTLPELRAAMERRRRSRSAPERVLQKLIGLDLKVRQYEVGKRFCDGVVAQGGIAALDRVWSGPEALPTTAELDAPADWAARTQVRSVTKSVGA